MFTNEATRDKANRVLDYIDAHPEVHNQAFLIYGLDEDKPLTKDTNICGTAMCVAGTVVFFEAVDTNKSINEVLLQFDSENIFGSDWYGIAGPALGLENDSEWDWLFEDMDNASALRKLQGIARGEITHLDHYGNVVDLNGDLVIEDGHLV